VASGRVDEFGDRGHLGASGVAAQQPKAGRRDEHEPEEETAEAEQADGTAVEGERGYDLIVMMREAQRSEPDIDAAYQEGRRRGREGQSRMFGSWPPDVLREGVSPERASDIFAGLCNVDVYRVLTEERGWTPDQVEEWWREALTALLLR
jgi:hypothetical protein